MDMETRNNNDEGRQADGKFSALSASLKMTTSRANNIKYSSLLYLRLVRDINFLFVFSTEAYIRVGGLAATRSAH